VELRQLRYFVAVAEEHHFGRAASRLRIATPSLSQQIRALERDLRATLLHRDSHGVALTPAGESLLRHARALLARAERARSDVRTAGNGTPELVLRVATGAELVLGGSLRQLGDRAPHLRVSVVVTHGTDAVHAVREERADAAIVWAGPHEAEYLARTVLRYVSVHVAVAAGHRLAAAVAVPVGELGGETVVFFDRRLSPGAWDRMTEHLTPGPRIVIEPDHLAGSDSLLAAVAAGRGLAMTVPEIARQSAMPGIVVRPLDPPLTLPLELVWREPAEPALQQLVAVLSP
jgi:DNA-binding transcriptional LysR family regulator